MPDARAACVLLAADCVTTLRPGQPEGSGSLCMPTSSRSMPAQKWRPCPDRTTCMCRGSALEGCRSGVLQLHLQVKAWLV